MKLTRPWAAVIAVGILLTVSFGTVLYGFSIYVTDAAAGAEFTASLLSLAYAGSVVISGLLSTWFGRWMDRNGTRLISGLGGLVTGAGLFAFAAADGAGQLVAAWWLLIGPGTAMTYYEPAYVVINQRIVQGRRAHALGIVTVIGGLAGAIFIPLIESMSSSFGWQQTVRILGGSIAALGLLAALVTPAKLAATKAELVDHLPIRTILADRRFRYLTIGFLLTGVSSMGLLAHRIDRFTEAGFAIGTVAAFAGAASLISLPGRFVGPLIGGRRHGATVLVWFVVIFAGATALTVPSSPSWLMPAHFVTYGVAFGAINPLRALAMDQWYGQDHYGKRMGLQQTATLVLGGLGPLAVGVLRDATGSWLIPMSLLLAAALAGLGFMTAAVKVDRETTPATPSSV